MMWPFVFAAIGTDRFVFVPFTQCETVRPFSHSWTTRGFYEYFHGDNGAGIGASHQTGWTSCIARIIQANGRFTAEMLGERNIECLAIKMSQDQRASLTSW